MFRETEKREQRTVLGAEWRESSEEGFPGGPAAEAPRVPSEAVGSVLFGEMGSRTTHSAGHKVKK